MLRREALARAGSLLTLPLVGALAGCQTAAGPESTPTVTPADVPTDGRPPTESRRRPRRTVVRSLYVPTAGRVREMDRVERRTLGNGDGSSSHLLAVLNESTTPWNLTLRLRRGVSTSTLLLVQFTLPGGTYRVYELAAPDRYDVRIEGDAPDDDADTLTDEFAIPVDWFDRDYAVTVAGITLDGYWRGTLLNRGLVDEFGAE